MQSSGQLDKKRQERSVQHCLLLLAQNCVAQKDERKDQVYLRYVCDICLTDNRIENSIRSSSRGAERPKRNHCCINRVLDLGPELGLNST